jgi:hypothetical protein
MKLIVKGPYKLLIRNSLSFTSRFFFLKALLLLQLFLPPFLF